MKISHGVTVEQVIKTTVTSCKTMLQSKMLSSELSRTKIRLLYLSALFFNKSYRLFCFGGYFYNLVTLYHAFKLTGKVAKSNLEEFFEQVWQVFAIATLRFTDRTATPVEFGPL